MGYTFTLNTNHPTATNTATNTYVNMMAKIPNGVMVTAIGAYNTYATVSLDLKIFKRTAANTFEVVASENLSHQASGWEDLTLASPYTVPDDDGDYFVGYYAAGTRGPVDNGSARAVYTGDIGGIGQSSSSFTESDSYVMNMRFTYETQSATGIVVTTLLVGTQGAGNNDYTMGDRQIPFPAGATITKMGFYSDVAGTLNLRIAARIASGDYRVDYDEQVSHGGSGWEDFTLSTPYVVGQEDVFPLSYQNDSMTFFDSILRYYRSGNYSSGESSGWTQDHNNGPRMRYTYSKSAGLVPTIQASLNLNMVQ